MPGKIYLINEPTLHNLLFAAHSYWTLSAAGVGAVRDWREDVQNYIENYAKIYGLPDEVIRSIDDIAAQELKKFSYTPYN